jgi:hypothetical protein
VSLHVNRRVAESTAKGERKDTHRAPAKRTSLRYASRKASGNARIMRGHPFEIVRGTMCQVRFHAPSRSRAPTRLMST